MIGKLIKGYKMNDIKDNPYGKYNGNELDYKRGWKPKK